MIRVQMTVQEIMDSGLWEDVCEQKGWDLHILSEGQIQEDEVVEFELDSGVEGYCD